MLADEAITFMRENQQRPFLLNLWTYDVHAPFQGKAHLQEKYKQINDPQGLQSSYTMGAMIETMDTAIGRVLNEIDKLGLHDNTIVILTSDNGGHMYKLVDHGVTATSNAPLRGGKATNYEGGVRVPLIVRWPGKSPAGKTNNTMVISPDLYPSMLSMLDLSLPSTQVIDGVDVSDAFAGAELDRGLIFNHFPHSVPTTNNIGATMAWDQNWKLIRYHGDGEQFQDRLALYNLAEDIAEKNNLIAQFPDVAKRLNTAISEWLKQTNALVPVPNPRWNGKPRKRLPITRATQ